jgi:predicted nuclease of predicted toxin-antitoxin system
MAALKVDENLPAEVSFRLREAGHDGISIYDQQMVGSTEDHILAVCQNEKRAIVTLDLDFADTRLFS